MTDHPPPRATETTAMADAAEIAKGPVITGFDLGRPGGDFTVYSEIRVMPNGTLKLERSLTVVPAVLAELENPHD